MENSILLGKNFYDIKIWNQDDLIPLPKLDIDKLQDDADDLERQLVKGSAVFALNQRNYSFNDKFGDIIPLLHTHI